MINLSPVLIDALQEQLTHERQNAVNYAAMSSGLEFANWAGGAHWMKQQAIEETEHAGKIRDYLIDRNVVPRFETLDSHLGATALAQAFAAASEIESDTTAKLIALYALAELESDPQTCIFLHWFLTEQVEEERRVLDIIQLIQRADSNAAMLIIDKRLHER
jgi:ferritin